jgi:SNF2 family DNA or RNA helicase
LGLAPLLADDMGLGKTVQTLAVVQERALRGWITSVLVVAPPATLENWRHETIAFAPAVTPALYHGIGRSLPDDMPRVVRTSYQTLRADITVLGAVSWDIVVFDEIQTIKNAKTKTYRAAGTIPATHRIALSGTPVENTSLELHAIVDILNPGILGNRTSFIRRFGAPIEQDEDPETRERLRTFLRPLILRRRKSEVARDLPERDDIPLYVALPPEQRSVYNHIRDEYRERLREVLASESPQKRIFLVLEGLTRLRQAAIDHRLVTSGMSRASTLGSLTASAKIAAVDELVPRVVKDGHRVLIFSQFVQFLSMLTAWADERRLAYSYLDGAMSPKQRQTEIERFQSESGPPLFFISLRAGGTGINLTAADYVILMDPWWNPAVEEQAIDRTHRIGQTRPVTAYRIIAADTVEEKIAALQERKRRLAADIVPDERTTLAALSTEKLLDLFS